MKWIIGLDLRDRSGGALRFATWLAGCAPADSFVPVHVLEEEHLRFLFHHAHLDEVLAWTGAAAARALAAANATGRFGDVHIVRGARAEEALAEAVAAEAAGALVVGRIAKTGSAGLVRLGRVARRLVRHLPAPLVLVPPDLAEVEPGPIVALTALERHSVEACRFARDLARLVSRQLAVLHVVADPALALPYGLPQAALDRHRQDELAAARAGLATWLAAAQVEAALAEVRLGDAVDQALAFAGERRAALIVTGARRRHSVQRIYAPSVGRELAASAPRPVAIVPPDGT